MMHATLASTAPCPQVGGVFSNVVKTTRAVPCKPVAAMQRVTVLKSQGRQFKLRVQAEPSEKPDYVDYESSQTSVFQSEACEDTGENCDIQGMGKDVNPSPRVEALKAELKEGPDRDYEEYAGEKTVFPGEACDELGGEFCEPAFQEGVYPDKVGAGAKK